MAVPHAYLSHAVPGRTRWRIPAKKADSAYFRDLERRLGAMPDVIRVEAHPRTASVVVRHHGEASALARRAEQEELFTQLGREPSARAMRDDWNDRIERAERWMTRSTGGRLDLPMALALLLAASASVQLLRGRVAPPAATLAWYALNCLFIARSMGLGRTDDTRHGNGSSKR